ncbi:DUF4743 domain-containing protein [Chitiniphilus purpureus]|uniref:DUF4743 domain-containing protein n=1 Tax=Chitiniphilus purpureus TaxID=2981137 RepID=A0ABY6DHA1_9NEIS|nr:DUF4743 domain-containing protein [Chitiniphilus sp. CD1]UXY13692.1 DUF4743 domain-containing protein [Chitiniphilus sp. CD1]
MDASLRRYLAYPPRFETVGLARLHLLDAPLGWLEPETVRFVLGFDPAFRQTPDGAVHVAAGTPAGVGALLERAAEALRDAGLIRGWRDERYTVFAPLSDGRPDLTRPLFALERSAFRRLGLISQAVHVNGYSSGQQLWIGRRAASKAIDPGRLDNLAAGGLAADETRDRCAIRELWEEAGVPAGLTRDLIYGGTLRVTRNEPDGTHDEVLHCYDLCLPEHFVPCNMDGEVAGFYRLTAAEAIARLPEFTWDAGTVTGDFLARHGWA